MLAVDYISNLPDALLGEIISLLPVKDGGRTQVLASRWRRLWRSTPLTLDCVPSYDVDVSSVLEAHPGPARRFCVRTRRRAYALDAWLRSGALDNLQEFEISGYIQRLPASIFRFSHSLNVANFMNCELLDLDVPRHGLHFPQLKQLRLGRVGMSDHSLQTLIDGCTALKFLFVYTRPGFSRLRINSPTLISICVRINATKVSPNSGNVNSEELIIENAPLLERIMHRCVVDYGMDVSVLSMPKVENLSILNDWHNFYTGLRSCSRIIKGFPVEGPTKSVHTVKILVVDSTSYRLEDIIHLMNLFPCLEKLHMKSTLKSLQNNCSRPKHQDLRTCQDICLKTLVLESYQGTLSHINFAKFFILNARFLELMTFHIDSKFNNEEFLAAQHKNLELEKKASIRARFHFTTISCRQAAWKTM